MKENTFTKFKYLYDTDNDSEEKINQMKYYKHLFKNFNSIDPKLIKYFGFNFFHDGRILNLNFNHNLVQLTFNIDGPNIQFYKDITKKEFELIDCNYLLEFNNVVHFSLENQKFNKFLDPLKNNGEIIYICSEVNSLEQEIFYYNKLYKKDDKKFNSLIIQTAEKNQYISIIFEYVNVISLEPLSYNIIQNDEHYKLHYCDKAALKKITTAN